MKNYWSLLKVKVLTLHLAVSFDDEGSVPAKIF